MLALSGWMKGTCDFRVFCLVEKDFAFFWGLAYLGICVVLLAWVFAFCFLLGCLCFDSCVGICALILAWVFALRAVFLNVNGRQWPLMVVNVFWLALLAMIVNVFLVDYAPMRVNGFATA